MPSSSCLCGSNLISYTGTPTLKFRCHCTDERKLTGAAFALNVLWPSTTLSVVSGALKVWGKDVENGNTISNHSCGECGSLLYRTSTGYPGMMVLKAGCMDDGVEATKEFVPEVEIYTRSRAPWVPAVEGSVQEWAGFGSGAEGVAQK
ncbi:uncharacterized protein LY89DRAFT_674827 [Mollisia scopiformis]|uniref:CENP-V/GFA domain-containing protein n=1 Tax=Mollisia scopiformis TaxID=149040 RepID=A0A194WRU0_MOLSC|nr:uncharacterized protein LY89DRAFT_674827 [Mollisia scopiformis]KUJ10705.1 hypothetical protein LY89DRAFT_674827 [Mollisia scopiformis]